MSKWISVEDNMPAQGRIVMVFMPNKKRMLSGRVQDIYAIAMYSWESWTLENNVYMQLEGVTHWMPLPEPPEKSES